MRTPHSFVLWSLSPLVLLAAGCVDAQSGAGSAASPGEPAGPPVASTPPTGTMTAGSAAAAGNNMFRNSTFEEGMLQPWAPNFGSAEAGSASVVNGEACLKINNGGSNTYDVLLRQRPVPIAPGHKYQVRFKAHSTAPTKVRPKVVKAGNTELWSAVVDVTSTPQTFVGTFDATVEDSNADFAIHFGGDLTGKVPLTVCIDDLELNDPKYEIPAERAGGPLPKIRINQVGYLPELHKLATVKSTAQQPLEWQLVDASGKAVANGKTTPFGEDKAAGEMDQLLDFSSFKTPGKGYKLKIDKDESLPFDIGPGVFHKLKYDALAFFYHQRSGVPIEMPYAGGAQWTRPAGHVGDKSVPCAPTANCKYSLDVSGGWYDAGDHGKYVVNGGISLWTLQNQYERTKYLGKTVGDFADGKMSIPENKNGKPDLLDEARFEMEWMLRMQVPAGKEHAGMAQHKIHSEKWAPIPQRPELDAIKRYLRGVGTAATLNLAATAAQSARIWKTLDPAFSKRCLEAAEAAWRAAKKEPAILAEGNVEGGGAYGDSSFEDEFYWAAAELFITTGKADYQQEIEKSSLNNQMSTTSGGGSASMSWDHVEGLGKISLAVVPSTLDKAKVEAQRKQIQTAADVFLANIQKRAYRVPLAAEDQYPWGSNTFVLNDMVVMGLAFDFTKDKKYVDGVVDSMDYILGRNPKVKSYVSGYGSRPLQNPHHRFWAHQKDAKFPAVPPGVVSGGPNSGLQDPYAKSVGLSGCAPQTCYVDHIESWSTNEIAINWNAPLAWAAAFLDDQAR